MIETLGSKTASPVQGPVAPALVITGITFAGDDLARPRYGSLIHQDHAPAGVQFEPCLQIRDVLQELPTVRFEIAGCAGVMFVSDGGNVQVSSIFDPQNVSPPGLVSATIVQGDPRKCDLVWDQSAADLQGFSRPNENQVAVDGFLPAGHPFQLYETTVGMFHLKEKRKSTLTWAQETGRQYCATSNPGQAKRCYCILGQSSGFGLRAGPGGQAVPDPGRMANIDPTVIQPPNCTSSGICITP